MPEHYTSEADATLVPDGPDAVEEARKKHHLATADPDHDSDGSMTGPAHEEKYNLERQKASEAYWRAAGVHPQQNRALVKGEPGAENLRGATGEEPAGGLDKPQTTAAARASK